MSGNKTLSISPLWLVVVLHASLNPFLETDNERRANPTIALACNESKRLQIKHLQNDTAFLLCNLHAASRTCVCQQTIVSSN